MVKKVVLAMVAVFVLCSVLDFVMHNVLLASTYEATAELWRRMEEMKIGLMYVITAVWSCVFVLIYALLVRPRSVGAGLVYGLLFGLATGIGMGFGSYCYTPIPLFLAVAWCVGTLIEVVVAGIVAALIIGPSKPKA